MYSREEAMGRTLEYFDGDELAASVWVDKYALRGKDEEILESDPSVMHTRLAREFARIEQKKFKNPMTEEYIFSLFDKFKYIVPQGSPMAGIGSEQLVSLSNCFVVDPPTDDYGGILHTDEQIVQISKRRGGVGLDISALRPSGTPTSNSSRTSSGIIPFMERFSNSIREVGQNGRRGALMITISVHHPQIMDFITVKNDPTKVTGANISIRLTDEFLRAVADDLTYQQRWPANENPKVSKMVRAREVWQAIVHSAWLRAEPGLLFWDNILRESPADCYASQGYETISTNPCSELPLSILDSCRLLLLNVFSFIKKPFTGEAIFDGNDFYEKTMQAQRLMDDMIDLELESVERILAKLDRDGGHNSREAQMWERVHSHCELGRRTGTGITGLGDAIAALGMTYGSDKSIEFTERIYRQLKLACYHSSVEMAKEIGPFPYWDAGKEKDNPFLLRIKDEMPSLYNEMQKYGRRNIALLTTAPAGTVSTQTKTSSGIEPVFMTHYTRRKKINHSDKEARVDFTDKMGDKWQEFPVYHDKVKLWMQTTGETDLTKSPYHGACAEEINWQQRVKLQAAAQKHIDHAISSTINLPEDVTEEKVAEIYETAWRSGCKGMTVYRKNCRSGVLIDAKQEKQGIVKTQAPKRPKAIECDIHHLTVKKQPYFCLVGIIDKEPYEVIAGRILDVTPPKANGKGKLKKVKRGHYDLYDPDDNLLFSNVTDYITDEEEAITRLVSTSLRHGADVEFVCHQLEKVKGELLSFSKCVSRVLKKYLKDGTKVSGECCGECGSEAMVRAEGCSRCQSCGASKCS